ncbi:acetyl-CoA carboxylase biotin carboxylase subunit [Candidimonas sp. SYP-B2681]|uniref:acetyl-CoA carboxylase biotin carboxylase subunit n=1 Tax=Candidimonas sp. SYP-B2681 TaxID=2497686 RepID=UPI000F89C7B7|nr:biotin carboxylase N-terminal domain-containing protein [Candidimonas sp. SYP-B2681]RTZ39785.1 acetyl-CoA carboxylase biotin carboxylase subunit [Candidimonas sp. SYP-B2681]
MADKLLIANRGEIACRIIQSCKRLGIQTVAVYSEADSSARHVELADESVAIGPAAARESYLKVDAILEAARRCGATAVHPGYGFLSENAEFASAVMQAGMVWVGPSPQNIIDMGDKERARAIAKAAGVPVLPGSTRFYPDAMDSLAEAGEEVGFPLLVKAAAGGGGIGMRQVDSPDVLDAVVRSTQSMAGKAFGDAGVYLERFVPHARHIEVQVFGFGDGTAIHLHDRECSVQRRFQKIIEEAPAPELPDAVRSELHRAAVSLACTQKYSGAGTVEFIYDRDRETAYFLEMNTRIQVEHPTTEMVTGIDIVAWQLLHALGRLDKISQDDITIKGHAVECRLYAERPEKNFLPSPGLITALNWPETDASLRIDSGVRVGDRITSFYDPMIAKLIAHGQVRQQAIERLIAAFEGLVVEGPGTNANFLAEVMKDARFQAADVTTGYVDQYFMKRKALAAN